MPDPLERTLELASVVGEVREIWRGVELQADELFDAELDLRVDSARMTLLEVIDRLEELVLNPPPEPMEVPL